MSFLKYIQYFWVNQWHTDQVQKSQSVLADDTELLWSVMCLPTKSISN